MATLKRTRSDALRYGDSDESDYDSDDERHPPRRVRIARQRSLDQENCNTPALLPAPLSSGAALGLAVLVESLAPNQRAPPLKVTPRKVAVFKWTAPKMTPLPPKTTTTTTGAPRPLVTGAPLARAAPLEVSEECDALRAALLRTTRPRIAVPSGSAFAPAAAIPAIDAPCEPITPRRAARQWLSRHDESDSEEEDD